MEDTNINKIHIETLNLEESFNEHWNNPPKVRDLKQELEDALPNHSIHVQKIDEYLANLESKSKASDKNTNKVKKVKSEYQPRLIRKQAEWRYPSLSEPFLNSPDMFKLSPRTQSDVKLAQQSQILLNYQFNNQIDKVELIDELVRAAVDEGTVIVRTGWKYEISTRLIEEPVIEFKQVNDPNYIQQLEQLIAIYQQQPEKLQKELAPANFQAVQMTIEQGVPIAAIETGEVTTKEEEYVVADHPEIEVCDYRSVIIDPTCKGKINNAKFVIYKFETSKSELKASNLYKNLDYIDLNDASILKESDDIIDEINLGNFNFKDDARKRIVAYEYWGYWDTKGDGIARPIVATFVNDVMIRLEDNPFTHGRLPFDVAKLMPKRKQTYGEPDGELILDNQKVVGAVSRGMIDLMAKSANSQVGFARGFLDPLNRRRFNNQEHFEFNPITAPDAAIHQFKYPEIPASAYNMVQMHQQDAESFTGVKAFQQGISGDSLGSSVGGIKSALSAAGKRELSILRRLVSLMTSVGRKVLAMNAQFIDEEQVIRITETEFQNISPDDLKAELDITIEISTLEEEESTASELAFLLQTIGNNAPFEITQMILSKIARLRRQPDLANALETFEPQPDPFEEAMKEIELRLKNVEAMELETQAKRNLAAAEKDLANARKLQAEADGVDLNTVEQEAGVSHAREIENMKAQSEGNIELELVKSAINENSTSNNTQNS